MKPLVSVVCSSLDNPLEMMRRSDEPSPTHKLKTWTNAKFYYWIVGNLCCCVWCRCPRRSRPHRLMTRGRITDGWMSCVTEETSGPSVITERHVDGPRLSLVLLFYSRLDPGWWWRLDDEEDITAPSSLQLYGCDISLRCEASISFCIYM